MGAELGNQPPRRRPSAEGTAGGRERVAAPTLSGVHAPRRRTAGGKGMLVL